MLVALLGAADWEGLLVRDIQVRSEDANAPAISFDGLQEVLPQKQGQPYHAALVRESIEKLYATGRFSDIRAEADALDDGVKLTFITKSSYFVGSIKVLGVESPPGDPQLRSATHLELGKSFSEGDIPLAIDGLLRILHDEGYFSAKITPKVSTDLDTQQAEIEFDVVTGRRARMGSITISGAHVIRGEKLLRASKWKRGKPYTSAATQNGLSGIRKLYQKENYLSVSTAISSIKYEPSKNAADVELTINAGPKVTISISGAAVSRDDLHKLIPVYEEGSLDEELLVEGQRNLVDYFQSRGYFDATVTYPPAVTDATSTKIEYRVDPGQRQRLEKIEITGNQYFSTEILQERLRVSPAGFGNKYGRFSNKMLDQDLESLRYLYQSNGFGSAKISSRLIVEGASEKTMTVFIEISEGQQTRVAEFSFTGNKTFASDQLEGLVNGGSGQPYSKATIAGDSDTLLTFYLDKGFSHTQFNSIETAASLPNRMDISYVLNEGPQEFVNHVYVRGLGNTRLGVVNRELQLKDGNPLSNSGILETQRRLYDLGVFSRVQVAVQNPLGEERNRNVLVYVEEAKRYTFKVGLGGEIGRFGGSTTDPQAKSEFSPDLSAELARINVGGRPHTATLSGRLSRIQTRGGLTYTAPKFLNHPSFTASARAFLDESRDVRTFSTKRIESGVQFENKRSKITTLLSRYTIRRVTVDTDTFKISAPLLPILARPVLVGILNQVFIRDTRDDPADSHTGMFSSADLGLAAKSLASETSFVRMLLQNSTYHRFGTRFVLARSTQFGVQSPYGQGRTIRLASGETITTNEIPVAEHFFSGGGNSHRGFASNDAGPRDLLTGFPLGGNALLLNSLELRFPIWRESLGGVIFEDAGNVFAKLSDVNLRLHQPRDASGDPIDFNYISHAVGFGVRYHTPVGPVRFDVGYNLNPPAYMSEQNDMMIRKRTARWQFLFSIGQNF